MSPRLKIAVTEPRRPAKTLSHDIVQRITKHAHYVARGY
jgi:hypothetical protein